MKTPLAILALCGALGAQTHGPDQAAGNPRSPDYKLPATFETKLPNGLSVTLVEDQRFPWLRSVWDFWPAPNSTRAICPVSPRQWRRC